jgi:hypothetical protein
MLLTAYLKVVCRVYDEVCTCRLFILIIGTCSLYVTQGIEMSRMSANHIPGKTAKYDQRSSFGHFPILIEMNKKICFLHF